MLPSPSPYPRQPYSGWAVINALRDRELVAQSTPTFQPESFDPFVGCFSTKPPSAALLHQQPFVSHPLGDKLPPLLLSTTGFPRHIPWSVTHPVRRRCYLCGEKKVSPRRWAYATPLRSVPIRTESGTQRSTHVPLRAERAAAAPLHLHTFPPSHSLGPCLSCPDLASPGSPLFARRVFSPAHGSIDCPSAHLSRPRSLHLSHLGLHTNPRPGPGPRLDAKSARGTANRDAPQALGRPATSGFESERTSWIAGCSRPGRIDRARCASLSRNAFRYPIGSDTPAPSPDSTYPAAGCGLDLHASAGPPTHRVNHAAPAHAAASPA